MKGRQTSIVLIIAIVVIGVYVFWNSQVKSAPIGIQIGNTAPNFTLTDLDGNEISLLELRGYNILLNFWATWCPICQEKMADLQKNFEDAEAQGQNIYYLTVNLREDKKPNS